MREFMAAGGAGKKQRSTYFLTHLKLVKGAASGSRGEEAGHFTNWAHRVKVAQANK